MKNPVVALLKQFCRINEQILHLLSIEYSEYWLPSFQVFPLNNYLSIFSRGTVNGPIILQGEDSLRTQYVPPEPTVKILKRPARNNVPGSGEGPLLNGDLKPRQPIKTLQQVGSVNAVGFDEGLSFSQ
jgi:hypothetical protein